MKGEVDRTTTLLRSPKSKEDPYVRFDRETAQDAHLSFAARGLLLYVFSKPPNWKAKLFDLQREGGIGKDALNTILKDLQDHGYIERTETRGSGGRFQYRLMVYESPDLNPSFTGAENPQRRRCGLTANGKPAPVSIDGTRAGALPVDHKDHKQADVSVPYSQTHAATVGAFVGNRGKPSTTGRRKAPALTPQPLPKGFRPCDAALAQVAKACPDIGDIELTIMSWKAKRLSHAETSIDWNIDFIGYAATCQKNAGQYKERYG